jgi:hypothetical protein
MISYSAAIRTTSNSTNKIIPHVRLPRWPSSHRLTSTTSVARGQAVNRGVSGDSHGPSNHPAVFCRRQTNSDETFPHYCC